MKYLNLTDKKKLKKKTFIQNSINKMEIIEFNMDLFALFTLHPKNKP